MSEKKQDAELKVESSIDFPQQGINTPGQSNYPMPGPYVPPQPMPPYPDGDGQQIARVNYPLYGDKLFFNKEEYLKHFNANYKGVSEQAKELQQFLKDRETGRSKVPYIPWAVLIRMATQQDANFDLEKVRNIDGSFLFYNGITPKDSLDFACYFVKVKATFFGKTITEEYPVQDFDFEPVSFAGRDRTTANGRTKTIRMDSNIINKALQRGSAKVISLLTGLGLSLYETGDLQFEEDPEGNTTAPTPPKKDKIKPDDAPSNPTVDPTVPIEEEQLKAIEELSKDTELKPRIDKALKGFKVDDLKNLTKIQAAQIITVLNKPKKTIKEE